MESSISIHDRYQVELKVGYLLPQHTKKTFCTLDLYLFAPVNLGVNPETYTHQQFYTDLQANIRLKTPCVSLAQLVDDKARPLSQLKNTFENIAARPAKEPPDSYQSQIKLYCCILKSAMRDFVTFIKETPNSSDRDHLVGQFSQRVQVVAKAYRSLRTIIQVPGVGQRTLDYYFFGDEYISLLIEDYTCHLIDFLSSHHREVPESVKATLLKAIREETNYRKARGYPSVPEEQSNNETLVFRRSVLKKFVASILFLNTEVRKEGVLLEQALFGLAAAVAMIFATGVTFISQTVYGALTLPVFIAVVVSYIFKDRLKDLLRFYLSRKISRYIYDKRTKIYDVVKNRVGYCKEGFEFLDDRKLPAEIRKTRNRDHITEIENGWVGEQVILYRKRISLHPERVQNVFKDYKIDGVNDIIRLNIQEFLRRMDDPKKELFIMDDEGFMPAKGSRVYHLNMITKLVHNQKEMLKRYRIVMTRKGIKRIEAISSI